MEFQKSCIASLVLVAIISQALAVPIKRSQSSNTENVLVVREGHPIELFCKDEDDRSATVINWLHNGHLVAQSPLDLLSENTVAPAFDGGENFNAETETKLIIPRATTHHSGKYTCVADTPTERTAKSFIVEVEASEKPIETTEVDDVLRIYQFTSTIWQTEGEPVYAVCRATQGPNNMAPIIRWTLGDMVIAENNDIGAKLHANGDLEIPAITADFHWIKNDLNCNAYGDNGQVVSKGSFVYVMKKNE